MPVKALVFEVMTLTHFIIILTIPSPVQSNPKVGTRKHLPETDFTIEINRRHHQAKRHVFYH